MSRELKVWYTSMGRSRTIVAARTKKEAAAAFGFSVYVLNAWADETSNDADIQVAMSKPGQAFGQPNNVWGGEWVEVDSHHA